MNNNFKYIGIIFGTTKESTMYQFNKILQGYNNQHIYPTEIKDLKLDFFVRFENGDHWHCIKATDNSIGLRCNFAYIDKDLDKNFIEKVLKPQITRAPFAMYNLYEYNEENKNE